MSEHIHMPSSYPEQLPEQPPLAASLGLVDGEFSVQRSSGQVEDGWTVANVIEDPQKERGNNQYVVIRKTDQNLGELQKTVAVDELMKWQPKPAQQPETEKSKEEAHYRRVFSPIQRPENTLEHPGYDHLFNDDEKVQEEILAYNAADKKVKPQQLQYDKYVTEQSRESSANYLVHVAKGDSGLRKVLNDFAVANQMTDPLDFVDSIRTDPELRFTLGMYLLGKVSKVLKENPELLPERVRRNTQKATSGLIAEVAPKVSSREYTALLGLAHLDGSYNVDHADDIEYGRDGVAILGQHRYAADTVLNYPA